MPFKYYASGKSPPLNYVGTPLKVTFHCVIPLPLTEAIVLAIQCKFGQPKV